jgi:hypothetical protein
MNEAKSTSYLGNMGLNISLDINESVFAKSRKLKTRDFERLNFIRYCNNVDYGLYLAY